MKNHTCNFKRFSTNETVGQIQDLNRAHEEVKEIADRLGVKWDGDKEFMEWTYDLTGKRHLDDMTNDQLLMVANALENGDRPGKRVVGFWRFTHPDAKMNDDDASRQPLGLGI